MDAKPHVRINDGTDLRASGGPFISILLTGFQVIQGAGKQEEKEGADENAAENIGEPMHTGDQPSENGDKNQNPEDNLQQISKPVAADIFAEYGNGAAQDHKGQHGVGRGERRFQMFVAGHDDRPFVDDHKFKQNVHNGEEDVKASQHKDLPVHLQQTAALDQLEQPKTGKANDDQDGEYPEIIGDLVPEHAYAGSLVDRSVHPGKTDAGPFWTDCLYEKMALRS